MEASNGCSRAASARTIMERQGLAQPSEHFSVESPMSSTRFGPVALTLLLASCGGAQGGGGGAPDDYASMPPFCGRALEAVERHQEALRGPDATPPGRHESVVVGAVSDLIDGMNALVSVDYAAAQHQTFVNLMTLVQLDENFQPVPYLAERWELSEDRTTLTFFLRRDVNWHDGTPTTAFDVAFTYRRAVDPGTGFPNGSLWARYDHSDSGVTVIDDHTVQFKLEPHLSYLDGWRSMAILPAHLLEDVASSDLKAHPYGTRCPVGNGPFVFESHADGDNWSFRANPEFPEALGGTPAADRYIYRVIPDQNTLMTEFEAGGIDIYMGPLTEHAQRMDDRRNLSLITFPFRQYTMVVWNQRQPHLSDRRVRQAITMATDRKQMLDVLKGGFGQVANGTVPPFHPAYDARLAALMPFDPPRARSLLRSAGWEDRDGDGVVENAVGEPLDLRITYNSGNVERQRIAEIMQAQLKDVGIRISVEAVEWGAMLERLTSPDRDFDGATLAWVTDFTIDDSDLFGSHASQQPFALAGVDNPEIDRLLTSLKNARDQNELRTSLQEYQAALIEEQPYTFLYFPDRMAGVTGELAGVAMDARGEWVSVIDWTRSRDHAVADR